MRAFAAVFTREIFERRVLFVVALASGFVPLLVSLATGWSRPDAAELRVLVALVGAAALSAAFALLLGGAVLAGETREKRISFFFSRPIPSGAIWAGKLLSAIAITLATAFLVFVPAWLSGNERARNLWGLDATPGRTALAALALAVVFVLGSHAVVTVGRLRSPWVALDLILAPTLVFLAAVALRSLARDSFASYFRDDDPSPAAIALVGILVAAGLGLVLATFVQVAEGRTDARRAHGAFSVAFFGISGFAVALVGGYAAWCASAKATDLAIVGSIQPAPRGSWVSAGGPLQAWRGNGTFLYDIAGVRSLRVRGYDAVFSQDGAHAAWGEPRFGFVERKDNRRDVLIADLATGRSAATGLEASGWGSLALSPSGRRIALLDGETLSAYDVSDAANPKQLAAFPFKSRGFAFVDEDTLLGFPRIPNAAGKVLDPALLEITELSLPSKRSLVTGRMDGATLPFLRLSPDGRFFVGTRRLTEDALPEQAVTLHDGRTGALVATLTEGLRGTQARFLTGHRIAVAGIAGAQAQMKIFLEGEEGRTAAATRTIELGPAKRLVLGEELAPGRVAVSLLPFENLPASARAAKLAIVDAATGALSHGPDGLVPANRFGWWFNPVLPPAEAGTPASSLFLDADNRLVRLDPASGARTVLLGKGK